MHTVLWLFPRTAAIVFAIAGLYFFADPAPLAKMLGDWAYGRNFNRVFGTVSLIAAVFFAVPQLHVWGVAAAGFVLSGMTVALLERRKYIQSIPGALLLAALPIALIGG